MTEDKNFFERWREKYQCNEAARAFAPVATYNLVVLVNDFVAHRLRHRIIEELYTQVGGHRWGFHTDPDFATGDLIVHFHMRDITVATFFALRFLADRRISRVAAAFQARAYL